MEDILSQFGPIFSSFGASFGGEGGGHASVARGSDLRIHMKLTLEEIDKGVTKKVKLSRYVGCKTCGGSGAAPGSEMETC